MISLTPELWYQILSLAVTVLGTVAVAALRRYLYARYTDQQIQTARRIAEQTVAYVEQVYREMHGPEKLVPAIDAAKQLATKAGINLTDDQWRTLIEAAVRTLNGWSMPPDQRVPPTN